MVKTRCSLPYPEKKTLFKVFMPMQSSQRLRIPPDFIKYFNGEIPSKSTILSSEPRSWPVDVIEIDDSLYLDKGWETFVQDNALEFGDFLVFHYAGKDDFRVKIFAKDGSLKGFTDAPTSVPTEIQAVKLTTGKSPQQLPIKDHVQRSLRPRTPETGRSLRPRIPETGRSLRTRNPETGRSLRTRNPETGRVGRDVRKNTSTAPFFKVVMLPPHISGGTMNIPCNFARSYLKPDIETILLLFSGKSWPVKLSRQSANSCVFSEGWKPFCRQNRLRVGDVCIFQLVKRKDCSFTVTISRRNVNRRYR